MLNMLHVKWCIANVGKSPNTPRLTSNFHHCTAF